MKNSFMKIASYGLLLPFLSFMGCAVGETTTLGGPSEPVSIIAGVVYKPFASGHDDKFSLGDFDSPYLVRLDDHTNFVASNSSILLNNTTHEVNKTDYQGSIYLGIAGFSFSDYTSFLGTNDTLTIKISLATTNGSVIVSGAVARGLLVTGATNIYTWQDLQGMKHDLAGEYVLQDSVTFPDRGSEGLAPEGFEPVGNLGASFTGSFAGNDHRIVNLSIDRNIEYAGIWGFVNDTDSVIRDFVLDHAGIRSDSSVGVVVGRLETGMVSNVGVVSSLSSNINGTSGFIGGLVGENWGTVAGYATGDVTGTGGFIGGLVGENWGTVVGYATGDVAGTGDNIGGLVGYNNGEVIGYATGAVEGAGNDIGGLVGHNEGTLRGYATGDVFGAENVGGLVGDSLSGTVVGYATGDVAGTGDNIGGLVGHNEGILRGYATGRVSGMGINLGGLVGRHPAGTANGYWDIGSSMRNTSAGGNTVVGISSITNVVFNNTANTYTDTKGNDDATDDDVVFENMVFTNSFTLPGASATWPTLDAVLLAP